MKVSNNNNVSKDTMNIKSRIADVITDPEDQPDVARIMLAFASARPGCEDA
jgi:hypothetical protein